MVWLVHGYAAVRLSRFNQYVPNYPEHGSTLVHNTLAGSFAILETTDLQVLRRMHRADDLSEAKTLITAAELDDPDVAIVVSSHSEEDQEFLSWFEAKRKQTRVMDVTVGLNLACNFECSYCCQAKVMDGSVMTLDVVTQGATWVASHAKAQGLASIHLTFLGGEPLLHTDRLILFAKTIAKELTDTSIAFTFGLTTNGYFFDPDMVERLLPYGLTKAQITIDGDASTHSKTRISKQGEDTFERVLSNAISASRKIDVTINGNYQPDTIHAFVPLLDRLQQEGLPPGSYVSFSPALGALGSDAASLGANWAESSTEYQVALHDETLRRGFRAPKLGSVGPCEFHEYHSFAIGPKGQIYKCPAFLGEGEAWAIGEVSAGLNQRYQQMIAATPQSPCDGCAHRPNCGGGCVADAMLKADALSGVSCEKGFFERNGKDHIVRAYQLASQPSSARALDHFPRPSRPLPTTANVRSSGLGGQRSRSLPIIGPPQHQGERI